MIKKMGSKMSEGEVAEYLGKYKEFDDINFTELIDALKKNKLIRG